MDNDNPEAERYLIELCTKTQGDTGTQISMFEVGAAIGLDKAGASMIAEELIVKGLAELRSLSGGISITSQGAEMIQGPGCGSVSKANGVQLGNGQILGEQGSQAVEKMIKGMRETVLHGKTTIGQLEEIIIDIKTIEIQMLSPQPKTDVIREVFRSLHARLADLGFRALAAEVETLIAR